MKTISLNFYAYNKMQSDRWQELGIEGEVDERIDTAIVRADVIGSMYPTETEYKGEIVPCVAVELVFGGHAFMSPEPLDELVYKWLGEIPDHMNK